MHRMIHVMLRCLVIALTCMFFGMLVKAEEYLRYAPKGIEIPQAKLDELTKRLRNCSRFNSVKTEGSKDGQRMQVE